MTSAERLHMKILAAASFGPVSLHRLEAFERQLKFPENGQGDLSKVINSSLPSPPNSSRRVRPSRV